MPNYDEEIVFNYHKPRDQDIVAFQELRDAAKALALLYRKHCPSSRELSIARTLLEQSNQMANAAIARHPAYLRSLVDTKEAEVKEMERIARVRAQHPDATAQKIIP